MFVGCAGGCPGSGVEKEVSLELAEVLPYHWEGNKKLACMIIPPLFSA